MSVDSVRNDLNHETKSEKNISLVPWYSTAQFKKVYEYLYSSELVKKRWAVDQISVWETRCHPSLPTGIEASVVISRAIIQDILLTNGASLCQERDIQMMYAMALVRFVNLTIEVHQISEPNLVTAAQTARGLGIPSWIVDLRNEAAHSLWPSLPSLRMAAETTMKYLSESFWEKEISNLKNLERKPMNEMEITALIKCYITQQYNYLTKVKEKKMQSDEMDQDVLDFQNVLQKLAFCIEKNKRQFINIFISDGLFIPTEADLEIIMSPEEFSQFKEEYDDDDGMEDDTRLIPPLPAILEVIWKRFLSLMNTLHAIPTLLELLLKSQADRTEIGKKLVLSWVIRILRIHCVGDCFEGTTLKRMFRKKGLVLNWRNLFYAAVSKPCTYTPYVFPLIFSRLDLTQSAATSIMHLMAIALGQTVKQPIQFQNYHSAFTLDHMKQMKYLQNAKKKGKKRSEECIWSVATDISYKSWPIGIITNPVDDAEKTDEPLEDLSEDDFVENGTYAEKCILGNENDNQESVVITEEPDTSEDEMDLSDRETFLYRKK